MDTSEESKAGAQRDDAQAAARAFELPESVRAVFAAFELKPETFEVFQVGGAIELATRDVTALSPPQLRGVQAELAALGFVARQVSEGEPWNTHFRPLRVLTAEDGSKSYTPDLALIDPTFLAYWTMRAAEAKHPVLVARYADLVWDTTPFVTKSSKRERSVFALVQKAIDSYVAASKMDSRATWVSTGRGLARALYLARSIKDAKRAESVVAALIDSADREDAEDRPGAYCGLFDQLLSGGDDSDINEAQQQQIISKLESQLTMLTVPGGEWDVIPHRAEDVGVRLAKYHQRKGRAEERTRVLQAVAATFERASKIGNALLGLSHLESARKHYADAGLRDEAARIQVAGQAMTTEAKKFLVPMRVSQEIPREEIERFLRAQVAGGIEVGLGRWVVRHLPDQKQLEAQSAADAGEYPMYAIFGAAPTLLGDEHIEADVSDDEGDPDGRKVYATSHFIQLQAFELSWILKRLVDEGVTSKFMLEFILRCPFITEDRRVLISRGVEAHFSADYVQSIHVLVPQIERIIVNMASSAGKAINKPHRTGKGVMQVKALNNLLERSDWSVPGDIGENIRMYLLSALAHPKGMNIRNHVCHGLWSADHFNQMTAERVLHVLAVLSLLREDPQAATPVAGPDTSRGEASGTPVGDSPESPGSTT